MKIYCFIGFLLIPIMINISCSKGNPHKFTVSESENGVQISINSDGPKFSEPIYNIEETLSLGGEEPTPKLYQPNSFIVDDNGALYFTDENRVKKFDKNGTFLQYIGRKGQGPGEVFYPKLIHIFGDTLYIKQGQGRADFLNAYYVFKTNGEFIEKKTPSLPLESLLVSGMNSFYCYLNQNETLYCSRLDSRKGDLSISRYAFGLINQSTSHIIQLKIPEMEVEPFFIADSKRGRVVFRRPYILQKPNFDMHKQLYCLLPSGEEIFTINFDGKIINKIILDLPKLPVTINEKDSIKSLGFYKRMGVKIKNSHIPLSKPLVCDMVISDDGYIWLKHGNEINIYNKTMITYRILDPKGEYLCDQILPLDLKEIKERQAYGFERNEDGLLIFKRLRLIHK